MNVRYFKVADITVEVRSDYPIAQDTFHPKFKQFEAAGQGFDNILITHHFQLPDLSGIIEQNLKEVYKKDQWQISKANDVWVYKYYFLEQ